MPDFDSMEELMERSARLRAELIILRFNLAILQAEFIREAKRNKDYWTGSKPPTDTYCKAVVMCCGNTREDTERLLALQTEIADKTEEQRLCDSLIRLGRDKLDLFRTMSANTRKGFLND